MRGHGDSWHWQESQCCWEVEAYWALVENVTPKLDVQCLTLLNSIISPGLDDRKPVDSEPSQWGRQGRQLPRAPNWRGPPMAARSFGLYLPSSNSINHCKQTTTTRQRYHSPVLLCEWEGPPKLKGFPLCNDKHYESIAHPPSGPPRAVSGRETVVPTLSALHYAGI